MSKVSLSNITNISGNPGSAESTINENFRVISEQLDLLVSRDAESPNSMQASLDMNSKEILNLGSPTGLQSAARWADVVDSVDFTGTLVPSQTGNADRFLGTDGTTASWRGKWPSRTSAEVTAGVTPTNYDYPPGHAFRYGMSNDGTTDNTSAFNNAVLACTAGYYTLWVPGGTYRFASRPNTIGNPISIRAEARGATFFLKDYNEATASNGFISSNSGALFLENLYIYANTGRTGGAGIKLTAQAGGASPDYSTIRGCVVTGLSGTGTWNYAIYLDGSARTSAPEGIRDITIENCDFFAATTEIATFTSCNNLKISNTAFFPAGGTSNDIRINGAGANTSNNVIIHTNFVEDINIVDAAWVTIVAAVNIQNINNTATVSNVLVVAPGVVAQQAFWANSRVVTPTTTDRTHSLILTGATPSVSGSGVAFGSTTQTTIGANGAASALTANPVGYLRININGLNYIIPYYNN